MLDRLQALRRRGESYSDVILRLAKGERQREARPRDSLITSAARSSAASKTIAKPGYGLDDGAGNPTQPTDPDKSFPVSHISRTNRRPSCSNDEHLNRAGSAVNMRGLLALQGPRSCRC